MARRKQNASIAKSKQRPTRRGSGCRVDAIEDRGDPFEQIGLLSDFLAAWRVWRTIYTW
jgi:hypothetical protein